MQEPKIMVLVTCEDGHQVEMYPAKVIHVRDSQDDNQEVFFKWECPRCERPKLYEIEIS